MLKKNKSRDPLLYIQQPEWEFPKADMQQTYSIHKVKRERETKKLDLVVTPVVETVNEPQTELDHSSDSQDLTTIEQEINNRYSQDKVAEREAEASSEVNLAEVILDVEGRLVREGESEKQKLNTAAVQEVITQYNKVRLDEDKAPSSFFENKNQSHSFKRVKSFKEMNTAERLNYLVHFPKLLPPVPCIFITSDNSIRGFLLNKTEDSVEVKQFDDKIRQIPINHLTEVKMVGLR